MDRKRKAKLPPRLANSTIFYEGGFIPVLLIVIFIAMKTKVTRNTIPTVVTIVIWTRFPLISASALSMGTATEMAPLKSPYI